MYGLLLYRNSELKGLQMPPERLWLLVEWGDLGEGCSRVSDPACLGLGRKIHDLDLPTIYWTPIPHDCRPRAPSAWGARQPTWRT